MSRVPTALVFDYRPWVAAFLLLSPATAFAQDETFDKAVVPFLKQHCQSCHGPKKQESRLRLDDVTGMQAGNRNLWTMVHERLAAGEMPPKERSAPPDAQTKQVLQWIVERQRALGPGGTRRLDRRELAAALRDVTGLG